MNAELVTIRTGLKVVDRAGDGLGDNFKKVLFTPLCRNTETRARLKTSK